ncbi:hypothetical protein [Halegenticoccus tardaugens]|uniref:hypothetical protein n=1 Tax=Halegenticoccus tardaugens TaxID=2071624 RepID=UPI00100B5786|nr:hypothetical protein [Halegenticoccus tardaugens]
MTASPTDRRAFLRAAAALFAGVAWSSRATGRARADDIVEFRSGSTDRCTRFVEYEERDGEEFEQCAGSDGGFTEEIDDDGDEERAEFDRNGLIRRRTTEDEDGEEEERIYDENGTLRFRREEDDDEERTWWFDENGTLRVYEKNDEDGDDVHRIYDANGALIDSQRDDDDLFDD